MVSEAAVLRVLEKVGAAIADSHIVYTSGKHGTAYVDKDSLYPHTQETSRLCRAMANEFDDDEVEMVVAPEKGGIVLSQWVAFHLSESTGREVLAFYAEKETVEIPDPESKGRKCHVETGGFVFKRGGVLAKIIGKNVLVVEDVLTTGGSAKKVVEAVRAINGHVVGLGVLCNRGGITKYTVGVPKLVSLLNVNLDAWDEEDCPLCQSNIPINTDVGKGREFLARKNIS